jgi:ABC-2 type transport system ATP-binding protein
VTVLLTTHLLEEADNCDRLAILDRGKLISEGTPSELKAEIGGEIVSLTASEPGALSEQLRSEFSVDADVVDGAIRFEHPEGSKWVARIMEAYGSRIESVTVSRPTLEDVFIRKTGHTFSEDQAN